MDHQSETQRSKRELSPEERDLEVRLWEDETTGEASPLALLENYISSRDALIDRFKDNLDGKGYSQAANDQIIARSIQRTAEQYARYIQSEPDYDTRIHLAAAYIQRDTVGEVSQLLGDAPSPFADDENAEAHVRQGLYKLIGEETDDDEAYAALMGKYYISASSTFRSAAQIAGIENINDQKRRRRQALKEKLRDYASDGIKIAVGTAAVAAAVHFLGRRRP